jgi:hypothetical protein
LGKVQGGAIRLAALENVAAVGEVVIATDLEEAAALGVLLGRPAWATANVKNLAGGNGLALPPEVRSVVIAATPAGDHTAVLAARRRFRREGHTAETAMPPGEASSYCEILQGEMRHGR